MSESVLHRLLVISSVMLATLPLAGLVFVLSRFVTLWLMRAVSDDR